MSETFIKEFHFSEEDMSICDGLIEYHSNNIEYKHAGGTQGAKGGKRSMMLPYTHHHEIQFS